VKVVKTLALAYINNTTCNFGKCMKSMILKEKIKEEYYKRTIKDEYKMSEAKRKIRYRREINRRTADNKLADRIKEKYGQNKEIMLIYGDWSMKGHLKGQKSTSREGIKRFLRSKFKMQMIDEFRTSKLDYSSGEEVKYMKNEKGKNIRMMLELQIQYSKEGECKIKYPNKKSSRWYVCRDKNAVRNFRKIFRAQLEGKGRPIEYKRTT
jgi:hypothetical protein